MTRKEQEEILQREVALPLEAYNLWAMFVDGKIELRQGADARGEDLVEIYEIGQCKNRIIERRKHREQSA